jgi:alpha-tubulin suppressor-like RCC1 family protein
VCWGANGIAQLGIGTTVDQATSVAHPSTPLIKHIALGAQHGCSVQNDNSVACWGNAMSGALGFMSSNNCSGVACALRPGTVPGLPPTANFVDVSVGDSFSCVLNNGGVAWCWGRNSDGQLGRGTVTAVEAPDHFSIPGTMMSQIRAGGRSACARGTDGSVWCWGSNASGQVGVGTTQSIIRSPTRVSLPGCATQVDVGAFNACAVLSDGKVYCWGTGQFHALGIGTTADAISPTVVAGIDGVVEVAVGHYHVCVRLNDGGVNCWGTNDRGQLGYGDQVTRDPVQPNPIPGLHATWISAGAEHTCAVRTDGQTMCWGRQLAGRIGNGLTSDGAVLTPTQVM